MVRGYQKSPPWVAIWLVICVTLNGAGWLLSAARQLNTVSYAVVMGVIVIVSFLWWFRQKSNTPCLGKFARIFPKRFSRGFPLAFLLLALLAFLGGILYAPNNYDALAYRLPRILHWLADGQWTWIHTGFQRLNTRACGYEWLAAPLIALTHGDRLLFLINFISFLLLPGLFFSVMTRIGIRSRVAWHWMWLLPTGYCYVLQAGSIANDMFSTVFALAALDYALRARVSRNVRHVWLCIMAVALLTGGKSSNIPLTLPALFTLLFSLRTLKGHIISTTAVILISLPASYVPMAVLNYKNCGDWSGQAAERSSFMRGSPVIRLAHNVLLLSVQNLAPPVMPLSQKWNNEMLRLMPKNWQTQVEKSFEPAGAHLAIGEMQIEEEAGIGFGITLLLLVTLAATFASRWRARNFAFPEERLLQVAIQALAIVSLFPFFWVSGLTGLSRLIAPYYALIAPAFLRRQSGLWIYAHRWWKIASYAVFLLAGVLLIVSPARPLWPAQTVLAKFGNGIRTSRALVVYSVYAQRPTGFQPVLDLLPPETKTIGFIATDAPEASLWKPFGHRRVESLMATDGADFLRQKGIHYVLLDPRDFAKAFNQPLGQWLAAINGEVVATVPLNLRAGTGPVDWIMVQIKQ